MRNSAEVSFRLMLLLLFLMMMMMMMMKWVVLLLLLLLYLLFFMVLLFWMVIGAIAVVVDTADDAVVGSNSIGGRLAPYGLFKTSSFRSGILRPRGVRGDLIVHSLITFPQQEPEHFPRQQARLWEHPFHLSS